MIDLIPAVVREARESAAIAAIAGARVRTDEPHGATATYAGDAQPAGSYVAFLVLVALDRTPERRVPVTFASIGFRAYGRTKEEATALYDAVVSAFHRRQTRLHADGVGVYASWVTGGASERDPDTQQPVVTGTIQFTATTQAVTA